MVIPVKVGESHPSPGNPLMELDDPGLLLSIPADIDTIVAEDVGLAVRWREATRMAFLHYFARGYLATELIPDGRVSHYVLTR
jgi:predicted GNAT superfamily acetyltransferase